MKNKPIYVLGTGLSHDGSACLIKDGKIVVAIEKERITRLKHDGRNDTDAIKYCLDYEGITIHDLDLVVQNGVFTNFDIGNHFYWGDRLFTEDIKVPVVTISHHLAHAYSTIGTCPFDDFHILIIDGGGNSFEHCKDLDDAIIPDRELIHPGIAHSYYEKISFYKYENEKLSTIYKDFQEYALLYNDIPIQPPIVKNSIGDMYRGASRYCFGDMDDVGKLMGLAPYGKPGIFTDEIFSLREGRVFVNYDWMKKFKTPAKNYEDFKSNFQYYADIAYWVQREVEKAITYVIQSAQNLSPFENLCYAGGVALNAVANAKLLNESHVKNIYIEPASGDNGIALGCAFYGWLEVLKQKRKKHNGSTCFGAVYNNNRIQEAIESHVIINQNDNASIKKSIDYFFQLLNSEDKKPVSSEIVIQFNIGNYGIYQVIINSEGVRSINDILKKPTSYFKIEGINFLKAALSPSYFNNLFGTNKLEVSDYDQLNILMSLVDLQQLALKLNHKLKEFKNLSASVNYTKPDNIITKTAEMLAKGKIIGWFQEGCEFGPRALGRRSILADPRLPDVKNFINSKVKFREDFRPFAPSVLVDDVDKYFQRKRESPYMILVDQIKEEWKDKLPGIIHVDGSCRIQTVTKDWSPIYYDLISAFKEKTGISVLVNTSFNRKGMPIVETPEDALNFFFSCDLDSLVLGNFLILKEN